MPPGRKALARQAGLLVAAMALPTLGATLRAPGAQPFLAGPDGLTLALAAGAFLAVEVLLIASVVRLWRAARARPRAAGRPPVRWGWELLWTVLPALGLLVLAILGVQSLLGGSPEPPAGGPPTPVGLLARMALGGVAGADDRGPWFD